MSTVLCRPAEPGDVPEILAMIRELAAFEGLARTVEADEAALHDALFARDPKVFALIAVCGEEPAGFAACSYTFSTFQGRCGLYLEDLYIRPPWRRHGVGKRIFRELAAVAVREGCGRVAWDVHDWNSDAVAFYERQGAVAMNEMMTMRLEGEALRTLATTAQDGVGGDQLAASSISSMEPKARRSST